MSLVTPFGALEQRASTQRNQAQAAARPARVRFFLDVVGHGEGEARFEGDQQLHFATFMLEEPLFTFGFSIMGGDMPIGTLPLASACVLRYHVNDRLFYTGADIGVRVRAGTDQVALRFSLIFDGYALRSAYRVADIPAEKGI